MQYMFFLSASNPKLFQTSHNLLMIIFTQFAHHTPSFIIHALQVTVGHSHHNRRGTELTHNSNAVQSRNGKESGSERALVDG